MPKLLVTVLLFLVVSGNALASIRDQEILECRAGEITTWNDGTDRRAMSRHLRFAYRHEGAPSWFSRQQVESFVARAADAWSACGITTELVAPQGVPASDAGYILVLWSEAGSRGNFGLANLGERTISLGAAPFALLNSRNPTYDARQTLQMVISHEMGHFFGLMAHSKRCVDVLSYYHDGKGEKCMTRDPAGMPKAVEYRHTLPTACDIARCRAINGR
jgi:hypothetical protein